jgi:hypothetical protein
MQQRRLRLGDILDDYCPRERRITNHAVVAMIEDDVRQTRCTTCDTEHEYKRAKMPTLRRKKDSVSQAYKEVLAAVTGDAATVGAVAHDDEPPAAAPAAADQAEPPVETTEEVEAPAALAADEDGDSEDQEAPGDGQQPIEEAGRVHRRLIRATLPRPENQQAQRPVPEFTMRQPQGRAGKFRGARGPSSGRATASTRGGGGYGNTQRSSGFGRASGGGRAQGARSEFHRPPRGGQSARRDKKHK